MKLNLQSRMATTVADLGPPSMIASSPTIEPGPRIVRIRSSPLGRGDADLEQALFEPIASVGDVACPEQHFSFVERLRPGVCQQPPGKLDRQVGQYAGEVALWRRTWRRGTSRCSSVLSCRHGDEP